MAISTQGDIVMDVMRAADPAAVETARTRLASFAGRTPEAGFSVGATAAGAPAAGRSGAPEAFAKFEAMVLQTFIQSMLPSDTESVYGEGMAGQMWQGMLAEQLGAAMAARGGIGIADRILRDQYAAGAEQAALPDISAGQSGPEQDGQRLLSVALVHEIQRKLAHSMSEDRSIASAASNAS